jgi:hypothetical protein
MTNNKQKTAVDWLVQNLHLHNDVYFVTKDKRKSIEQAKEMEIAGKEMSYSDGYSEGYNRAMEMVEFAIEQMKIKSNESNIRV